jgi:N-hydroxyarylamine O-acetyltransferase
VVLDLDAYLERIGVRGSPTIETIHRAQATSIPFENLDPHRGLQVALDPEALERKLVGERRGGYCFEQNLLLKIALEALGAQVDLFLARVRFKADGVTRPRGHLVLRARIDGVSWHADVGFGLGSLLDPLPFGAGDPHDQSGWRFRIVEDPPELVLQTTVDGRWEDLYGFIPQPVPFVDLETSNWWISTHPRSPFVAGLIVSTQDGDGMRTTLSDWGELSLTVQTPTDTDVTPVAWEQVPDLLTERFALGGFALDKGGRLVGAEGG